MIEKRFWYLVDQLGWGTRSTDYEALGKFLVSKIKNIQELEDMRTISKLKQKELSILIENNIEEIYHYWGGDDSYWDFRAHIVGLGEKYFTEVMNDVQNIVQNIDEVGDNYVECFDYVFTRAVEFTKTKEGKRLLSRERKFKRILKNI